MPEGDKHITTTLDDAWAQDVAPPALSPIIDKLVDELELTGEETTRLTAGLTAAFVRGIKATQVELTAQLTEAGISTFLDLQVDDDFEA